MNKIIQIAHLIERISKMKDRKQIATELKIAVALDILTQDEAVDLAIEYTTGR